MKKTLVWVVGVLVVLWLLASVKVACHECLRLRVAVVCDRGNDVVDVQIESNRVPHGYMERRAFAGCQWYWMRTRAEQGSGSGLEQSSGLYPRTAGMYGILRTSPVSCSRKFATPGNGQVTTKITHLADVLPPTAQI